MDLSVWPGEVLASASAELKQSVRSLFRPMITAYEKKTSSNKDHGIGPMISPRVFLAVRDPFCMWNV